MADGEERVCHQCFGDIFLKREVRRDGEKAECAYCGKTLLTLPLKEVADLFESAIDTHYVKAPSEPSSMEQAMLHEGVMDFWYPDGQPITDLIQEIGETSKDIAGDIQDLLEARHSTREDWEMGVVTEFHSESHYESRAVAGGELDEEWPLFEHNLKTKSRYMSMAALKTLEKIFHDLESHRTFQDASVIIDAGPAAALKTLFRARVFQSRESLFAALERPEISIGPPPPKLAGAGRMNARGIPVFYGATHPEVALAEVRPPVRSKVVVAQFDIVRPLRLLDVEALRSLWVGGSPFDPNYLARKQKAEFLRGLSERITMPVMPDDETLNYIATQVIAEYLASIDKPRLDGMIYPSVQAGDEMRNVVLFNKAAVVQKIARREDMEFAVSDYESYEGGDETEYTVREEFDSEYVAPPPKEPTLEEIMAEMDTVVDNREPALSLSQDNVWVHHIKKIAITSDDFKVSRREWDKKTFREFEKMQMGTFPDLPTDPIEI